MHERAAAFGISFIARCTLARVPWRNNKVRTSTCKTLEAILFTGLMVENMVDDELEKSAWPGSIAFSIFLQLVGLLTTEMFVFIPTRMNVCHESNVDL